MVWPSGAISPPTANPQGNSVTDFIFGEFSRHLRKLVNLYGRRSKGLPAGTGGIGLTTGMDQLNHLSRIALELGLPVEAINAAGGFFLQRIQGWRDELNVLHTGTGATLHTP